MKAKYAFFLISALAYCVAVQAMNNEDRRPGRARSLSFPGPERAEVLRPKIERPASGHPIIATTTVDHRN